LDDAAYVLGSLSPEERREYVSHLAGCAPCRSSVRELAGLPGLLARVEADDVGKIAGAPPEPPPATLWPRLLEVAQANKARARRRRVTMFALAACLAVLAAVAVPASILTVRSNRPPTPTRTVAAAMHTMSPVDGPVQVSAEVGVSDAKFGTNVALRCSYAPSEYYTEQKYGLFAVPRSGPAEQISSWTVGPGEHIETTATTKYHRAELVALEIRRDDGKPVLRAQL
jgi:hypothetical protein